MATVGTGQYTYKSVEDWAQLPAGWPLGQTGIVTDVHDRGYLFNRSAHPFWTKWCNVPELDSLMTLLTLDGQVLTCWTSPTTTGAGSGGHAVWVDSHADIYMNQNQEGRRLLKYQRCGDVTRRYGVRGA
jgi:hypothetical protein